MELFVAAAPVPDAVWQVAAAWLGAAIERGGQTDAGEVRRLIDATDAQLWTAWDGDECRAALVTTRHGDCLHLWLCGGHGCDWADLLRQIMVFSRLQGVTRWTVDGRKGWARVLKEVRDGQKNH